MKLEPGLLLALALTGAGCVATGDDSEWLAPFAEDGKADEQWQGVRLFARYALRLETRVRAADTTKEASCARDPRSSDCRSIESNEGVVLSGLVEVDQTGGSARLRDRLCDFRLTKYGDVTLEPKVFANLQPADFAATLPAADAAQRMTTGAGAFLFGISLADAMKDSIPTEKTDRRVIDQDENGRPGVSVRLPLGRRIDFGARFITALAGDIAGDGSIVGSTTAASVNYDFVVYDDNVPFVDAVARAKETLARQRVIAQTTAVRMLPLRVPAPGCTEALDALE
jgi:hypothetical protein